MKKSLRQLFMVGLGSAIILLSGWAPAKAEFKNVLNAHGGWDTWNSYGTVEYDMVGWPFSQKAPLSDHQIVDLKSRQVRIESSSYTIGFNGQDVWAYPSIEAVGVFPRFYATTPFYFLGIPFVLADPGVTVKNTGRQTVEGKEYDTYQFFFKQGMGDTPEDGYVVFADPDTHQVKLVKYTVSYLPFRKGKSAQELEWHTIIYDEWQNVGGLDVLKKASFRAWKDGQLGESHGGFGMANVEFKKDRPDPAIFKKVKSAVIDRSHQSQQ